MVTRSVRAAIAFGVPLLLCRSAIGVTFSVALDASVADKPVSGRLVVFLIADDSKLGQGASPLDGPFWDDAQPVFAVDVHDLAPGAAATVDDSASHYPCAPSALPPGGYRAAAYLDTQSLDSHWRREPGNLFTETTRFDARPDGTLLSVPLALTHRIDPAPPPQTLGVQWVDIPSKLLSEFRGRAVVTHVGVALPLDYDPSRRYAAIYEVPGFGGNHREVIRVARQRRGLKPGTTEHDLAAATFHIIVDPEGPNGHTLFADSANNGPCGTSLVTEIIPEIERRLPLVARPEARLLRGHSSGGWSTLWLAITYPETFGACWSTSPDPVDFRRMQLVDIYAQKSLYDVDSAGEPEQFARIAACVGGLGDGDGTTRAVTSVRRRDGGQVMTIRRENMQEEILGPDNTSAQQWDSWFAAWGPRNERGHPVALIDAGTGVIDRAVAEPYRAYDIAHLLRQRPEKLAPIFLGRVRLAVGDRDHFFLNEAVALLADDLQRVAPHAADATPAGYIKILAGHDHGTIFMAPEVRGFPRDMLDHLSGAGLVQGTK